MPGIDVPRAIDLTLEGVEVALSYDDKALRVVFPHAAREASNTSDSRDDFKRLIDGILAAEHIEPYWGDGHLKDGNIVYKVTGQYQFSNHRPTPQEMFRQIESHWQGAIGRAETQGKNPDAITVRDFESLAIPGESGRGMVLARKRNGNGLMAEKRAKIYEALAGRVTAAVTTNSGSWVRIRLELSDYITRGLTNIAIDSIKESADKKPRGWRKILSSGSDPLTGRITQWLGSLGNAPDVSGALKDQLKEAAETMEANRRSWAAEFASAMRQVMADWPPMPSH